MRILLDAGLTDHRLRQPLRMANVVEAEAARDAESGEMRRPGAAIDVEELIVLDLVSDLAADTAIRADAVGFTVGTLGADAALVDQRRFKERARRAGLDAFAAA